MVVSTIGFLCPVFTLLLLRSHNGRTGFGTSLTFLSWLLNTVIFFLLLRNLSNFGANVAEDALNQLFKVPTCGDSSAMLLCQQLTGSNPLERITGFFVKSSWTNIRTIPMLWVWTTLALLVLILDEVWQAVQFRKKKDAPQQDVIKTKMRPTLARLPQNRLSGNYRMLSRFIVTIVFIVLFSISLIFIFQMVLKLLNMYAIDTNGWSFGQVVAAMFWIPVFLDVAHSTFGNQAFSFVTLKIAS